MRIPARVRVSWKGRGGTLFTQNAYSLNSDRAPEGRQKVARRFIAGSRRYKKSFSESRRDDWGSAHVQSSLRDTSNLFVFGFRNPAINRRATLTSSLRDEETLEKGRRRTIGGGIHGVKEISVLHKEGSPNLTVLNANSYQGLRFDSRSVALYLYFNSFGVLQSVTGIMTPLSGSARYSRESLVGAWLVGV